MLRASGRLGSGEFLASEPGELAVPEHGVSLDGQRRHRAAGERPVLQYRHNVRPYAASTACGTRWVRAATWLDLERRCDLDLAQSVLDLAQIKPLVTAAG